MSADKSREETFWQAASAERSRRLWTFLFLLIAASLWIQWLGPGALAEIRSEDGSETVLALQLLPLAAAAIAVLWDHPAWRLTLFPISFAPGLAMLADAEWEALLGPGALILGLATLALYLIVAAARPPEASYRTTRRRPSRARGERDGYALAYRRFVLVRLLIVGGLFALITYALFWDPATLDALASAQGEEAQGMQHLFAVVVMYFAWMVAVYIAAVLPSLNWEYHRRRPAMPAGQEQLLADQSRLRRRVWTWLAVLLMATTVIVWWIGL